MAELPQLGRLVDVDLREVWASEPYAFTPWLASPENLQFLADSLELPGLELVRTEHPVDSFSADIVCKVIGTDHYVLIENQLERTDHIHLGQLLTYAPKFDARAVVWVAKQFTEAHRAALDWLNRITSDNYGFFGVEVRAVRIGNSAPAPLFDIVSSPNDWTKPRSMPANNATSVARENTENIAFWEMLDVALDEHGKIRRRVRKQVKGQNLWIPLTRDGSVYVVCYRSLGQKPCVGVYLGIYGDNRHVYWDASQQLIRLGDQTFSSVLRMETNSTGTVHKAISEPLYADPSVQNWQLQVDWMVEEINKFSLIFGDMVISIESSLRGFDQSATID